MIMTKVKSMFLIYPYWNINQRNFSVRFHVVIVSNLSILEYKSLSYDLTYKEI